MFINAEIKKWMLSIFIATIPMLISIFVHAAKAEPTALQAAAAAQPVDAATIHAQHPSMKEHQGSNELQRGEYEIIDLSGSVTRSFCPYTCADRGLAANNCKTWKSIQDGEKCYVQDTRLPSKAFQ